MSDTAGRTRAVPHPLLVFLALLVALLAIASLAVRRIPIDAFRHRIEAAFERSTGRVLTIAGPLRLTLLPIPGLIADDVSVANLPGGSRPVMAHVERFEAHVALLPLFSGRVHVVGLTLTDPDLLLERLPDGTPNWRFTPEARRGAGPTSGATARDHRFRFAVDTVDGTGGTLTWNDRGGAGTGEVSLSTFHAGAHDRRHPFTAYVAGRHGAAPFSLSLASASLSSLHEDTGHHENAGSPGVPVRASLAVGGGDRAAVISLDGRFADPLRLGGFSGTLQATIPSLASLNALLPHAALPSATDLALQATLSVDARGHERVRRLALSGNSADLGAWQPGLTLARFAIGAVSADSPLTVDVAGMLGSDPFALRASQAGTLALWQDGATGTAPLDVSLISGRNRASLTGTIERDHGRGIVGRVTGDLDVAANDPARLARLALHPIGWHETVAVTGHLELARNAGGAIDASLEASPWTLGGVAMPAGRAILSRTEADVVTAAFAIPSAAPPFLVWIENAGRNPSPLTIALDGKSLPAGPLAWALLHRSGLEGHLDASGRLTGTARGVDLDPATLSGPIGATLGNATLDAALAKAWLGPVLAAAHVPPVRIGARTIRCAGLAGRFTDGILRASAVSLDDPALILNGSGTADFRTRSLDLSLVPVLRLGGLGASAPVRLSGPFDRPIAALAPDAAGRFTLSIGRGAASTASCDASPDLGPEPAPPKAPRGIDILRGLGLFR